MALEKIICDESRLIVMGDHSPQNPDVFDFAVKFIAQYFMCELRSNKFQLSATIREESEAHIKITAGPYNCQFYDLKIVDKDKFQKHVAIAKSIPKDAKFVVHHCFDGIFEDRYGVLFLGLPDEKEETPRIYTEKELVLKRFKDKKCALNTCNKDPAEIIRFYDAVEFALNPGIEPRYTAYACVKHESEVKECYGMSIKSPVIYIADQDAGQTRVPEFSIISTMPLFLAVAQRDLHCSHAGCEAPITKSLALFDSPEAYTADPTKPVFSVYGCNEHAAQMFNAEFKKADIKSQTSAMMIQDFMKFEPPAVFEISRKEK